MDYEREYGPRPQDGEGEVKLKRRLEDYDTVKRKGDPPGSDYHEQRNLGLEGMPTIPQLFITLIQLQGDIRSVKHHLDSVNLVQLQQDVRELSYLHKKVDDAHIRIEKLKGEVGELYNAHNQCVWTRKGSSGFFGEMIKVSGWVVMLIGFLAKIAGWW